MLKLEETFNNTIDLMRSNKGFVISLAEEQKLELYKYYKQATLGDCCVEKPDIMNYQAYVKWCAWMQIKGVSRENAMKQYIYNCNAMLQMYCLSSYFRCNDSL
jgi:diazepam-binding inhibitor (GABA receptor modulating acyl-CoA-binding protein)